MKHTESQSSLVTPAKASILYTLSSLVGKSSSILTLPLFTRILSPDELGEYTLYMSVLGLCSLVASVWYSGNTVYKGLMRYRGRENEFLTSSYGLYLAVSLVILLGLFLLRTPFGISLTAVLFIYIQLLLDGGIGLYLSLLRYKYEYRMCTLITLLLSLLSPLVSIILIRVFSFGIYGRIIGLLSVSLAVGLPIIAVMLKSSARVYDAELWRFSLGHSLPLLAQGVSSAISRECDKLITSASLGAAALARYSVAHSLGGALSFLTVGAGQALSPWIMRKLSSNDTERASRVAVLSLRVMGAATVFLVALSPELMQLLAPRGYSVATVAVLPIALSLLPSFFSSVALCALVHTGKTKIATYASLTSALLNTSLSFILIPRLSYLGGGLALLSSSLSSALITLLFLRRQSIPELISARALCGTLISTGLLSTIELLLYNYVALRILLLIIPAIIGLSTLLSLKELIFERRSKKTA